MAQSVVSSNRQDSICICDDAFEINIAMAPRQIPAHSIVSTAPLLLRIPTVVGFHFLFQLSHGNPLPTRIALG